MVDIDLMVTLCPSFPHFERFAFDPRLAGIRFNSAQTDNFELEKELQILGKLSPKLPVCFDVKGRQLRVSKVDFNPDYLDLTLNHKIKVNTPVGVFFKAEADFAVLERLEEDGRRLIFKGGPQYNIKKGESLHILDSSLQVIPPMFIDEEKEKIEKVVKFGCRKFFLSYVEDQAYVDEFFELVGKDAEVWLKIENIAGLEYVARKFKKKPNLHLVAACGDLYVEIVKAHLIPEALKLIIIKDPKAVVGSRILLSVIPPKDLRTPDEWPPQIPSLADFLQIAWLYEMGYRKMMLCDELCLKESLLASAVNAFKAFARSYRSKRIMS